MMLFDTDLDVFLDESSDPKHERFFAVGGFASLDANWTVLQLRWISRTHELKEPFHSTDCETQHGQFKNWEKSACDLLMKDLVTIVRDCRIGGVGFVVPVPAFQEVFGAPDEYDPYIFCLKCVMIHLANTAHDSHLYVKFVVEENTAVGTRPLQAYCELKAVNGWKQAKRMIGFTPLSKGVIGLQAADLMARETFKFAMNEGTGRAVRKPLKRLEDRISLHRWSKKGLEILKEQFGTSDAALVRYITAAYNDPGEVESFDELEY